MIKWRSDLGFIWFTQRFTTGFIDTIPSSGSIENSDLLIHTKINQWSQWSWLPIHLNTIWSDHLRSIFIEFIESSFELYVFIFISAYAYDVWKMCFIDQIAISWTICCGWVWSGFHDGGSIDDRYRYISLLLKVDPDWNGGITAEMLGSSWWSTLHLYMLPKYLIADFRSFLMPDKTVDPTRTSFHGRWSVWRRPEPSL